MSDEERNALLAKVGFFALDQIGKWVEVYQKSKGNATMTKAEADALIAQTQQQAKDTVEAWDDFYHGRE